jgi:hypothetical protein
MTHTDEHIDELLRVWAAEQRAAAPSVRPLTRAPQVQRHYRRWIIAACATAAAVTVAIVATTLLDRHGAAHQAGGRHGHFGINPGCGAMAHVAAIGPEAIQNISVAAGGSFTVTGTLRVHSASVATVTRVQIIVGTPDALAGTWDPASAPPNAISRPENQLAEKSFDVALHDGSRLTLSGSGLAAGSYPVYGLLDLVNSDACGGHAGQEISQFATLTVS